MQQNSNFYKLPRGTEKNEQSQIKEKEEKADKTKQT